MSSARLTFLGTGTSSGVPQLRCECSVCLSVDPRDRRRRSSAILDVAGGPSILIDAGPDLHPQLLAAGSPRIDACLITHSHYDHVGGLDDLRPYCCGLPDGFPLVCAPDVEADLRARIPYCFREVASPRVPRFAVVRAMPFETVSVGGVDVMPLPISHGGPRPILGFRIGRFGYVTDCKDMPPETVEALCGLDTLVINALRHTLHPTHMNLKQALDVIRKTAPRKAIITHMSHGIGLHAETSRLLPDGVVLGFDGMTVETSV
ncbi:MAG: MBL fold metallo-hydrolase [Paramuribaculum sp.]|nr:MBL fold metallo-hydrolase [Paramuribaculum sp.]